MMNPDVCSEEKESVENMNWMESINSTGSQYCQMRVDDGMAGVTLSTLRLVPRHFHNNAFFKCHEGPLPSHAPVLPDLLFDAVNLFGGPLIGASHCKKDG